MSEISVAAQRIAEFAAQHPEYSVIAFDADGETIDWMTSGGWVNGSVRDEASTTRLVVGESARSRFSASSIDRIHAAESALNV